MAVKVERVAVHRRKYTVEKCYKIGDNAEVCLRKTLGSSTYYHWELRHCQTTSGGRDDCTVLSDGNYDPKKKTAYVSWFGVEERSLRGRGYGAVAYKNLEQWFKAKGVRKVELSPLIRARPFWGRRGFRPIDSEPFGEWRKRLHPSPRLARRSDL